MNCAACGNVIPEGAQACPYCGAQASAPVYQQSYAQYQTGAYPPGYQTPYLYTQQPSREENGFLHTLSLLPRAFADSFTQPGEVLRAMVERRDLFTAPVVAVLVLVMTFLSSIVILHGVVGDLYGFMASLSGAAGSAAAVNQGVTYIVGRIAPSVGGAAALCQLICMLVPTAVFMLYICVFCRVTFSWELSLGFLAITSMNTVAVSLLAMALSLLSPFLALIVVAAGMAVSYGKACSMLGLITARPENQLVFAKLLLTAAAIVLSLALAGLAGGALMQGVARQIASLLSSVSSLI